MSKTKVWIIGANGRLGSTISDALDRMEYNVHRIWMWISQIWTVSQLSWI